jgi:hypothetical protein
MGIGIVALFWAFVGAFLLAGYLLLALLGKRFPTATRLKDVLVAGAAAVVITVALILGITFALNLIPGHVFRSSFGFSPTSDVLDLRGRKFTFGDSGDTYLRFRASKETVNRILDSRFLELRQDEIRGYGFPWKDSAPSYWQPPNGASVHFFHATQFDDSFGSSEAFLNDESTGSVHFYWIGVD